MRNKKGQFVRGHKKLPNSSTFKKGHEVFGGFEKGCVPCFKIYPYKAPKGKNHYNWQGGITSLVYKIRNSFKYRQWRSDIFTRDMFSCQSCGDDQGGNLNADHYPKMFSEIIKEYDIKTFEESLVCEELWNLNNGRTLCKMCHIRRHKNQLGGWRST